MKISKINYGCHTRRKRYGLALVTLIASIQTSGCGGSGVNVFEQVPHGIYVSKSSNIMGYSADMFGSNQSELNFPFRILCGATDHLGNMYVGALGRVALVTSKNPLTYTAYIPTGANSVNFCTAIAFDSQNRLYFADYLGLRIVRIDDISGSGRKELNLAPYATSPSDMSCALAIDSQDRIYVAGFDSGKIMRFSSMDDASPASYTPSGPTTGTIIGTLSIAIDNLDRIYFNDNHLSRIVRMDDMTGKNWTQFGSGGSGINHFGKLLGLTLDTQGHIYIADQGNSRVVRIEDMTGAGWTTYGDANIFPDMFGILVR